jgi:hypothetical protein
LDSTAIAVMRRRLGTINAVFKNYVLNIIVFMLLAPIVPTPEMHSALCSTAPCVIT